MENFYVKAEDMLPAPENQNRQLSEQHFEKVFLGPRYEDY